MYSVCTTGEGSSSPQRADRSNSMLFVVDFASSCHVRRHFCRSRDTDCDDYINTRHVIHGARCPRTLKSTNTTYGARTAIRGSRSSRAYIVAFNIDSPPLHFPTFTLNAVKGRCGFLQSLCWDYTRYHTAVYRPADKKPVQAQPGFFLCDARPECVWSVELSAVLTSS